VKKPQLDRADNGKCKSGNINIIHLLLISAAQHELSQIKLKPYI